VCADAILRSFGGLPLDPGAGDQLGLLLADHHGHASWLTAVFAYDPGTQSMPRWPTRSARPPPGRRQLQQHGQVVQPLMSETFS